VKDVAVKVDQKKISTGRLETGRLVDTEESLGASKRSAGQGFDRRMTVVEEGMKLRSKQYFLHHELIANSFE
jgi:hypothetical protein